MRDYQMVASSRFLLATICLSAVNLELDTPWPIGNQQTDTAMVIVAPA